MKVRCTNCSYRWEGRMKRPPKSCPRCHRYTVVRMVSRKLRSPWAAAPPTVHEPLDAGAEPQSREGAA